MDGTYDVDIPILNWLFAITKSVNGWGVEAAILLCGCATVFYYCYQNPLQKNKWMNGLAAFFGLYMVLGRSYKETESWIYIINPDGGGAQLLLSFVAAVGFYYLFKNFVILGIQFAKKFNLKRDTCSNTLEEYLFDKYPFRLSLAVLAISGIPFMISFFPGALHWDGWDQLWAYFRIITWDAHHPAISSLIMGKCVEVGMEVFDSASLGLFFYTAPQYIIQWIVFAYTVSVLCRLKAPMVLRWGSLAFFAFFPTWQIWGYTLVKDTYYYLCILLFVLQMVLVNVEGKVKKSNVLLIILSVTGIVWMRNNGIHVLLLSAVMALILNRKYWKLHLCSLVCALLAIFVAEGIFMPVNNIAKGSEREMMSIPLQATARYLKYHMDELTEEEREVLEDLFNVELSVVANDYNPELSDPVKGVFEYHPTKKQFEAYFKLWFEQFKKHPATYIQAVLNHTYGYFYPDREDFWDDLGYYNFGINGYWNDGYMEFKFGIEDSSLRDFYERGAYTLHDMPLLGMLYSCGFHNYILIGCILGLLSIKQGKNCFVFVPGVATVLVCLVSPVDAFMRYMFPVIVCLPIHIFWYLHCAKTK